MIVHAWTRADEQLSVGLDSVHSQGRYEGSMNIAQYYRHEAIRNRMMEFLGGSRLEDATAVYLTGSDGTEDASRLRPVPVRKFYQLLERCYDVERSVHDRKRLIVDFDIDYENFDSAPEAYFHPSRTFRILDPVVSAAKGLLEAQGIRPLQLISGRGHHLVWSVNRRSRAFHKLAAMGDKAAASTTHFGFQLPDDAPDGNLERAFNGLGLLLEYLAHRVRELAQPFSDVPVQVTAIEVGPGKYGYREIASLDISEYGDPLQSRHLRIPFSVYLKPRRLTWSVGEDQVARMLPIFEIPLLGIKIESALEIMRSGSASLDLARRVRTRIPDVPEGTARLIHVYEQSRLAAFHRAFYSGLSCRHANFKSTSLGDLPACVRSVLEHPNDWLLKPAAVQHVTRVLLAIGWEPHEICALIRSRYEANFKWEDFWVRHNPEQRARFYVRLFAGLIYAGQDSLVDLNCVSHREKGYCTNGWCSSNLANYQQLLLRRSA